MVDEESQDVASAPAAGAAVNRGGLRDADILEGEAAIRVEDEGSAKPAAETSFGDAPLRSPPAKRAETVRPLAFGALGGLIVSALALAGDYYALAPRADVAEAEAGRLGALEARAQREGEEAQRQSAAIAGLDKRVGALEGASARIAAAAQAAQGATADVKSLKADEDGAKSDIAALAARLAKLESGALEAAPASPDASALASRVDKMEAALAAPKAETRAAPEAPSPGGNPAAVAIVAGALRDKLAAGAPFAAELTALRNLGVEPDKLTALQALAGGGPTDRALASSFDAVAPKVLAASSPPQGGGVIDRFVAHLRGLVQVRVLNEIQGDDPAALVSQIEAAVGRGDVGGALAAFGKLPEPARQAAGGWAAQAGAKEAADAALQSIREAAIGKLAAGAKP